jgi:phosphate transport system protein
MPRRKVQLKGGSTYTISLPKEWARDHGVEVGMQLPVHPLGNGELLVSVDGEGVSRVPPIDADDFDPETVRRLVHALYCDGVEEFVLAYSDSVPTDHRRVAREVASDRFGLEVSRQSEDELRFRTLLDAARLSVDEVVARMLYATLSMHRHATAAFVDGEIDDEGVVEDRRRECRAQRALVERYFKTALADRTRLDDHERTLRSMRDAAEIARRLEEVATAARTMAGVATDEPAQSEVWRDRFEELSREARDVAETAVEGMLEVEDPGLAHETLGRCTDLVPAIEDLDDRIDADAPDALRAVRATAALRRTVDAIDSIATVAIESTREG